MERSQKSRDTSSESDVSDWAVIDEDSSMEWNDEAKYHFRSHAIKARPSPPSPLLDQRVKEIILPDDMSDEDSIEVVSDHTDDNIHVLDRPHEQAKNVLDEFESRSEHGNSEGIESDGLEVQPDMIWYPLNEPPLPSSDNELSTINKPEREPNLVFSLEQWNSIYNIGAVLITSIIVMCFFMVLYLAAAGLTDVRNKAMFSRLAQENKILKHELRRMYLGFPIDVRTLKDTQLDIQSQSTAFSSTTHPYQTTSKVIDLTSKLNRDTGTRKPSNADRLNTEQLEHPNTFSNRARATPQEIRQNKHTKSESSIPEKLPSGKIDPYEHVTLQDSVSKINSLLSSEGKFQIDTEIVLSSCMDLVKRMERNLQVLDLVPVDNLPLKFSSKMSKLKDSIQKASNKVANKIDKGIYKLASSILRKQELSQHHLRDKFCGVKFLLDQGNTTFVWPNDTIFNECNNTINKPLKGYARLKRAEPMLLVNNQDEKSSSENNGYILRRRPNEKPDDVSNRKAVKDLQYRLKNKTVSEMNEDIKTFSNHSRVQNKKKITYCKKVDSNMKEEKPATNEVKPSPDTVMREDNYSDGGRTTLNGKSYEKTGNQKNVQNVCSIDEFVHDELVQSAHKMSNISGIWVINMAKAREEQRNRDHQSDWLFDRAESREVCRTKDGAEKTACHYKQEHFSTGKPQKKQDDTGKYWKLGKSTLKKVIQKPILNAVKNVKNVFKKHVLRSRQQ